MPVHRAVLHSRRALSQCAPRQQQKPLEPISSPPLLLPPAAAALAVPGWSLGCWGSFHAGVSLRLPLFHTTGCYGEAAHRVPAPGCLGHSPCDHCKWLNIL